MLKGNQDWLYRLAKVWLYCLCLSLFPLSANASLNAVVNELLSQADQDLSAGRLQSPPNNNAYDRYRAVLLLDKGNRRAALGLREIADRYIEKSRSYIKQGQWGLAKSMLTKAIKVNGRTTVTSQLAADIDKARQQARLQPSKASVATVDLEKTTFILNGSELKRRSASVIKQLAGLGQRVAATKEYVLIYARSDTEGRWIYQQMNKGSTAYRLRGNIQRHKKPKVILEPPL